jgi:drug/metabolite transporter (DMT)-like permease
MSSFSNKTIGILLAILATLIWSGNFVIARGIATQIGPVSLAFCRWLTASLIITPIAWKKFQQEKKFIRKHLGYLFFVAVTGVTIFNTCVYIAGHYTTAINMALIGTTSSPIFATLLAAVFLKDKPGMFRITGLLLCISGIVLLLSKGSWQILTNFRFSVGDLWVLTGAFAFAIYSTLVRKKPAEISSTHFLFLVFTLGTLMLLPFFAAEQMTGTVTKWSWSMLSVILYLGAGASVISFLCWNISIQKIGAGRTVLFGNLIPVFSVLEAVWLLGEKINIIHLVSGFLVIGGLMLANTSLQKQKQTQP